MPKTKAKYKAKPVFWNMRTQTVESKDEVEDFRQGAQLRLPSYIHRFDSQHEFKVYLELVRMYGSQKIKLQYPVELMRPNAWACFPKGKYWKVDFAIMADYDDKLPIWFVEAKGMVLPEFANTLARFEMDSPFDFGDLFIVFSDRIPKENRMISNLLNSDYADNLLTLDELKKRTEL